MGLFGLSFGKKKSSSSSSTNQTEKRTTEATRTAEQQSQSKSAATQQQQISSLSPEIQALVESLITQQATGQSGASELQNLLVQRAQTADQAFDPTAILNEARRQGEQQLGRTKVALSQQAGSSMNSLVQQLIGEQRGALESQLASLAAQLTQAGRQAATQEIAGAATLPQQNLTQLLEVLKGATVTGTTTTEQLTTQEAKTVQTLREIVDALLKSNTTGTTKSKSSGFSLSLGS